MMKVNGKLNKPIWKNISCVCVKGDLAHSYPLTECKHCKFQQCEDSLPKENFKINQPIFDKKGNDTDKMESVIIKEVTIVRGSLEDIIGWTWSS